MLTPQLPYPPHQGTSLRNLHILRALARGNDVILLSFAEPDRRQELEHLQEICHVLPPVIAPTRSAARRFRQLVGSNQPDVAFRLRSEIFSTALAEVLATAQCDAVQIEGIELAGYIDVVRRVAPGVPVILDCHNAETELQRRALRADAHHRSRWPAALYSMVQVKRLERYERQAIKSADGVIAVSDVDLSHLGRLAGEKELRSAVVPNTIDVSEYEWPHPIPRSMRFDLVFTGKMDYRPNLDAVLWFAEAIWPIILDRRPRTTWAIVGQKPHPRLNPLRQLQGVTITGAVPHIQPYLAAAGVYIMPLRMGSGTRLKLIEAMAAEKAVVSTKIGAEGFPVQDKVNILIADSAKEIAEAVLRLLDNPRARSQLGTAARLFAERYDWSQIVPLLEDFYKSIVIKG
jgi:glycosyltransferase involved in cell wall biosynthesis